MDYIDQPLIRGDLRRRLGREYYILRRKVEDLASGTRWARLAPPQEKALPPHGASFADPSPTEGRGYVPAGE